MSETSPATHWRALFILFAVTAIITYTFGHSPSGHANLGAPSSFNASPVGLKALHDTLENLHWPVGRWQEDLRRLNGADGVLILALPDAGRFRHPLGPEEIAHLAAWVKKGNRLVLLGDFGTTSAGRSLLEALGMHPPEPPGRQESWWDRRFLGRHAVVDAFSPQGQLPPLKIEETAGLFALPPTATVLAEYRQIPVAAEFPLDLGSVVLVASPSAFSNEWLPAGTNLEASLRLLMPGGAPPRALWFEESHHGYRTAFAARDLFQHPGLGLAMGLTGLGLLAYLASQHTRFGRPIPRLAAPARGSAEFVHSMASLYQRADLRNAIIRDLYEETRSRVLRRLHLPPSTPPELVARRFAEAYPRLPSWRKLALRFESRDFVQGLPPGGWLRVAQDLIRIKQEVGA